MIQVQHLSKHYGQMTALADINFAVEAGEVFAIIGKSGAGKSTLLRCLNLLERPSQGTVTVNQVELTQLNKTALRQVRRQIGMIFQHFNLLSSLTVYQNVALPLQLLKYDKKTIAKIVIPLLELTGLLDKQHIYPAELSGGQKQRVAIARALVNKPNVLLCDEATSALDPETTRSILSLLREINRTMHLTIVMITHEIDVVKTIASRLALLEKGRIVKQSNVLDFFTHSQELAESEFVHHYFQTQLPEVLQQVLMAEYFSGAQVVIKIYFRGMIITQPIIMQMIWQFQIEVNILQANIEYIQDGAVGFVVITINDPQQHVAKVMRYLHEQGLIAEILGYVKRDAIRLA